MSDYRNAKRIMFEYMGWLIEKWKSEPDDCMAAGECLTFGVRDGDEMFVEFWNDVANITWRESFEYGRKYEKYNE